MAQHQPAAPLRPSKPPRRRPASSSQPLQAFLRTEIAGAVVLLLAAAVALVWANSPLHESYETLWSTSLSITIGPFAIDEELRHWVNDLLMALFFFVVALEIKRELVLGELRDSACSGAAGDRARLAG